MHVCKDHLDTMLLLHAQTLVLRILRYLYDVLHVLVVYETLFRAFMNVVELDLVPDFVIRRGIRFLLRIRLGMVNLACWFMRLKPSGAFAVADGLNCTPPQMAGPLKEQLQQKLDFVKELKTMPIAIQTDAANEQHYEVSQTLHAYFIRCTAVMQQASTAAELVVHDGLLAFLL